MQSMWRRICHPDLLIYLDAQAPTIRSRLQVDWEQAFIDEMHRRLTDALQNADLVLETDSLTIDQVLNRVVEFIQARGYRAE